MSSEVKEATEATTTEETQVVVDKNAYKNLSTLVKAHIADIEASDKPSKKTLSRFEEVQEALIPVRDLLRARIGERNALREEVTSLKNANAELQEIVDNEPVKNPFEVRRLVSAFSGVTSENASTAPIDEFLTDSDPSAVVTRIKPITDVDAGVVGIKVSVTDTVGHIILFPELIAVTEAREGRKLDIDADTSDALRIYLEGMAIAIGIADLYTKQYGAFTSIPLENHKGEEAERLPGAFKVNGSLEDANAASEDTTEDEDGDVDTEDSDEGDDADEAETEGESLEETSDEPTPEEIQRRLAAEDDIGEA